MKKNLIALHGSYFGDNFGDRLFVEIFADWVKEINNISGENIVLPFANKRIRESVKCSDIKGIKAILKSKCIVFIGGGYFGEFKADSLIWNVRLIIRHLLIAIYASLVKKPYIFIGIGAGPLSNIVSRKLVTYVCNRSENVVVRDIESKEYLIEYGVKPNKVIVTADSVLGMESKGKTNKSGDTVKIGVHFPYPHPSNDINRIIADLKEFCDTLPDYQIYHFKDFHKESFNDFSEKELLRVFGESKVSKLDYISPTDLIDKIGGFDIVITAKLHVGIVALTQETHTISVAIHQKTERLYKQLGLSQYSTPLINYQQGKLIEMLKNWKTSQQVIPKDVVDLAKKNKEILKSFINKYFL